MKAKLFITALVLFIFANISFAQRAYEGPRNNQRERIHQGQRSGELTKDEAKRLKKEQKRLKKHKHHAKADGKISKAERKRLKAERRKSDKNINRLKHNNQFQRI